MATIITITEGVRKLVEGSDPSVKARFDIAEVKRYIVQAINSRLNIRHFNVTMGGGEMIPDGMVLAEYDSVPVERWKNISRATLPVMPVALPLNIGIFHVGRGDDPLNGFIPFQPGQLQMIGEEPLLSEILGQIGYEPRGKYLAFNKDITTLGDDSISTVYLLLVVKDLSLYGDWDMLPIPADYETEVIADVYQLLTGQLPQNKKVDVTNKQPEVQ